MAINVKIQGNFIVGSDNVTRSNIFRLPRNNTRYIHTIDGVNDYFQFSPIQYTEGLTFVQTESKFLFTDIIDDRTGVAFTSTDELNEFLSRNLGDFFFNEQKINVTPYNEQLTAEKTTLIELKSIYGISKIRDVITEVGTGTVTNDFREYKLKVLGAGDQARLTSSERGRYIPGKSAEYGIGVRIDVASVTGDTVLKWGALNDANGIYYGLDSTGVFVSILDNNVEITRIYQSSWNQDKLDGTGASGETLDLTKGNIFQAQYTWYGYGIITFRVQLKTIDGMKLINVHNYIADSQVSVNDPNLPITAQVKQTTATNTVNIYVGGRQFSILGSYSPNFRNTSDYVVNKTVGLLVDTPKPIISFKHKTSYKSVSASLSELDFITDNQVIIEVYLADLASLTDATFTTPVRTKAIETAFEVDKSATAIDITNANLLYRGILKAGDRNTTNQQDFENILLDIPESKVLVVTGFATTTSATVDGVVRINEEW